MTRTLDDDRGTPVELADEVARVVCLVPSLTEALATSCPERLVGATDWCTHPADLDVPRVRGTKNPDRRAIADLRPDLVVANQEESRELDVRRLREAGIPVWVTVIESVEQALASMRRLLVDVLALDEPAWLAQAGATWADPPRVSADVVVPVWRDPWMAVGARTFTGDLCARLGLRNTLAGHADRYPALTPAQLLATRPDVVLLPDEPYLFTAEDGPDAFPGTPCALVEGRSLTWYGPSLLTAPETLLGPVRAALGQQALGR
ncbi:helical backbone metal receptor [Rhodococcus aerolatus]